MRPVRTNIYFNVNFFCAEFLVIICMLMMQELTPEEQREWKELAKKIQDTAAPPDAIFVTISARDQVIFLFILI